MEPSKFLCQSWQMLQGIIEEAVPDLARLGLYPRAYFLLSRLEEFPYPAQLAEVLLLPAPTVSFIVRQLEKQGALKRELDRSDLRRYRLTLTNKGRKLLCQGKLVIDRVAGKRMARLTAEQLKRYTDLNAILVGKESRSSKKRI